MTGTGGGRIMFPHQQGRSFLDDSEPRPPPRIPPFPIPFGMEKPRMEVPDVSLIFNSSVGSNADRYVNAPTAPPFSKLSQQGKESRSRNSECPEARVDSARDGPLQAQGHGFNSWDSDELREQVRSLGPVLTSQGASIAKLEEKLDKVLEFQDKFLAQLFQKGSAVSKGVQTEGSQSSFQSPSSTTVNKTPPEISSSRNPCKSSSPSVPSAKLLDHRHAQGQVAKKVDLRQKGPIGRVKYGGKEDDDLSAILKDLQLPSMDEPSVFSDTSGIKSLELQEFNDDSFRSGSGIESPSLGASASTFGSNPSSDDESESGAVKPTATFYNNVLGNVNRLLEGGNTNRLKKGRENVPPISSKSLAPCRQGKERRRAMGLESSGVSGSSSSSNSRDSAQTPPPMPLTNDQPGDEVVEATKRYLEKLGVQFGSPSPSEKKINVGNNSKNYMIQQNVYNSIYIPTVNCPPAMPEIYESNADSGNFHNLAQKYVPPHELEQFDAIRAQNDATGGGTTETTVYGMSPNNLSFATKQYLQRYGLVNEGRAVVGRKQPPSPLSTKSLKNPDPRSDRILDITAIKNQPKLL